MAPRDGFAAREERLTRSTHDDAIMSRALVAQTGSDNTSAGPLPATTPEHAPTPRSAPARVTPAAEGPPRRHRPRAPGSPGREQRQAPRRAAPGAPPAALPQARTLQGKHKDLVDQR